MKPFFYLHIRTSYSFRFSASQVNGFPVDEFPDPFPGKFPSIARNLDASKGHAGVTLDELKRELEKREGVSGLEEKAGRK